jgi:hypothetical protein
MYLIEPPVTGRAAAISDTVRPEAMETIPAKIQTKRVNEEVPVS